MLKYVGKGAFLIGVPAHDLTDEEIEKLQLEKLGLNKQILIERGLYVEEKPKPQKETPNSKKAKTNPKQEYGIQNKGGK